MVCEEIGVHVWKFQSVNLESTTVMSLIADVFKLAFRRFGSLYENTRVCAYVSPKI